MWRVLAALALCAGAAQAGDSAALNPLGFSADGAVFAFEQYGVQDGSGFPYSEVFAVDLAHDRWVAGTPIRRRIDNENAGLATARAQALAAARPLLQKLKLGGNMVVLAHNPETEVTADRGLMSVRLGPMDWSAAGTYDLRLKDLSFPAGANCPSEDGRVHGFRLTLTDAKTGKVLDERTDKAVPASRGCALGYELELLARSGSGDDRFVAVIAIRTLGFEGPDRRFMAVPVAFPHGAN